MKKLLLIILIIFLSQTKVFSEDLVLNCRFNAVPDRVMNFHINTEKQHWIQSDTTKYKTPQLALTYKSKFLLAAEIPLNSRMVAEINKKYNDNAKYINNMIMFDINRYSGEFEMHTQTTDKKNFKKYLDKMNSLKGWFENMPKGE